MVHTLGMSLRFVQGIYTVMTGRPAMVQADEERSVEDWVNLLQPEVAYCAYCQPYDSGECIWILGVREDLLRGRCSKAHRR
jgi:hypothetical protein